MNTEPNPDTQRLPMKRSLLSASAFCAAALLTCAIGPRLLGQTASTTDSTATTTTTTSDQTSEEVVKLSPFVVESTEGTGYHAESTLAGTRVRTDLKDVASSISVVTADFLRDIGATNNQTLLQYTTNTEVGGIYGNYAGVGNTFVNGANESSNFLKPNGNTRVRGLDSADNTRDYFLTDIPWDAYNVGRVDLQRGPNSILFGIGSPAGIVNSSVNTAEYKNTAKVENRVGSFGTLRDSLDIERVLLQDELAIRVAALNDDTKYREKPAFNNDKRLFGALRWDPKLFNRWDSTASTTVRANYEYGDVQANRPRILPPEDRITPFFFNGATDIKKAAIDPYYAWAAGVVPYSSSTQYNGESKNYWLVQYQGPGLEQSSNPQFFYDSPHSGSSGTTTPSREAVPNGWFAIDSNGNRTSGIGGLPFGSPVGIAAYGEFAQDVNRYNSAAFPGASSGFYKNRQITDPSIFDFYNNLIDGPNKHEWQGWDAYNLSLEQTFLNNRVGFQVVYDRQKYHDGQERNLNDPYISVDITANTMMSPWAYNNPAVIRYNGTGTAGNNPNAGRAFVGSNGNNGGNSSDLTDRENFRATATAEIRADDFLHKSLLTDILGRHVFTGLYSHETYDTDARHWVRYAVDPSWSIVQGDGPPPIGSGTGGLIGGDRNIDWITYLSAPLFNQSSAHGLGLQPIDVVQSPQGSANIAYFDSHWKWPTNPSDPSYVNPGAAWTNPTAFPGQTIISTQSANPANYKGWTTGSFNILNADQGDLNNLYTDGSKVRKQTTSSGVTWQAYLWDGTIVATAGYRHDKQEQRSADSTTSPDTGAASMNFGLNPLDPATGISTGDSISWGVVMHTPKFIRQNLPWGSDISLTYSYGKNERVENRYGFNGETLPNAVGRTRDYGVVLSTLNDRVQLKATIYDTLVSDANLSSVTTEVSTLGNNTYYTYLLEAWGTGSALTDLGGMAGQAPGWEWYWDWAEVDHGFPGTYLNPTSAAFLNDPSTAKEKAAIASWQAQMQPQSWYDAYGLPINVAAVKAGDFAHAISGGAWQPTSGIGAIQASGKGRINGSYPTGTVNNESKGVEFELYAQPTKNWNITANASKQKADEVSLGGPLVSFIEAQYQKFQSPAGDLRLWWGGDQTLRDYYTQNIWAPYQFQKAGAGRMVPEMSPWRFNLINNYNFDHGLLKGVNVGFAYRWQQGQIIGYALNATQDNLDPDKPYWGKSEYWVDVWAGYSRKLSSKVEWRIQLNLRNLDSRPHLSALSVQPDGSTGQFKIEEGQTWELSNTFTF